MSKPIVAIVGRPNVGKSMLFNKLIGQRLSIVEDTPGVTRDRIYGECEWCGRKFTLVDTGGIEPRTDSQILTFMREQAQIAIENATVIIFLTDIKTGLTASDQEVANMLLRSRKPIVLAVNKMDSVGAPNPDYYEFYNLGLEAGKACIIVVNKWDLVEKDGKTMDKMREDIRRDLSYMTYAPILFISAATGQRVPRLFELINYVHSQACTRITTGMLNNVLEDAQTRVQPPTDKGKRLKIYYMTQVGVCPPHFVIFCNDRQLFHFSYQRYLENQIRSVFGLEGTPIIMSIRQKGEEDA